MKKTATILLIILLALYPSYSQDGECLFHSDFEARSFSTDDPMRLFFSTDPQVDHTKYNDYRTEFSNIVSRFHRKQSKWSDARTSEKLFYTLHRKLLKWYEHYASINDLFSSGRYDCVSGTALLAIAADQLGLDYTIHEFDYHTFLVIEGEEGRILLESTDPVNGVVLDSAEIERRIAVYGIGANPSEVEYVPVGSKTNHGIKHINNQIDLKQLAGLQYFNLAVEHYNQGNRQLATSMIEKAYLLYPSERIGEIRKVFSSPRYLTTR